MGYKLRDVEAESKFSQELSLEAIGRAVPMASIAAVLVAGNVCTQRERKLNLVLTVLLTIAMHIYSRNSLTGVMSKLARGLRYIWPDPAYRLPGASAISYRRYQLGARPLVALFHRVCQPMATPQTPGAYRFGLRLMALDGTVEDVPDTPANVAAFGRVQSPRGPAAFPQVLGVYLIECGTHAIVDAGFWPCQTDERQAGTRLLRSVGPGMLLLWDRAFHDYDRICAVCSRGAHLLERLPSGVKPERVRTLPDGSSLAYIRPSDKHRRRQGQALLVRVVEYTLTDPALPGYGERHRLLTTLLDAAAYPALELVCVYHERWEIELAIDETDTHQRLAGRPLRSLKPVGVIQELYALLIAHHAIRFLMHEAALQSGIDPDRLSFTHALQVICDAVSEFQMTVPAQLPGLYWRMLTDIAAKLLPQRRPRTNPRVVKRKMSKFHLKRSDHYHWPQPAGPFQEAIALI